MGAIRRFKAAARVLLGVPEWDEAIRSVTCFEDQIYQALVSHGDWIFDIGGNRGLLTQRFAHLSGASGKVFAFEPVWPTYEVLCANLRSIPRRGASVVPVPLGLGDKERMAVFTVPDGRYAMASLAPSEGWRTTAKASATTTYRGRIVTIDQFLSESVARSPDFIKIDVEGAELMVLKGAADMFASGARPAMLIEIFAPWERAFGYGPWEPLELLHRLGYQLFFACPAGLVPHTPTAESPFPPAYVDGYNVVAVSPSHHARQLSNMAPLLAGDHSSVLPMSPPPIPNHIR